MAANTFITKLTKECNKCRDFVDQNAIKTFQSEGESSAVHKTSGPLFKDDVPETITTMLKAHCIAPYLQRYDWSKWELAKP
ncbi:hypothetical protein ACFX19_044681 [Malus domestica]